MPPRRQVHWPDVVVFVACFSRPRPSRLLLRERCSRNALYDGASHLRRCRRWRYLVAEELYDIGDLGFVIEVSSAGANHEALPKPPSVATLETRRPDASSASERRPTIGGLPKARMAVAKQCFAWSRPRSLGHAALNAG